MKKIKKAQTGAYFAFPNGRVGRTRPLYKDLVEFESMDTTGYSKGKKNFDVTTSRSYEKPRTKTISREEVPSKISEMKKGASRMNEYKKPAKKSAAGSKITKAKAGKKVSKKIAQTLKKSRKK
jgi:hypothetical protein